MKKTQLHYMRHYNFSFEINIFVIAQLCCQLHYHPIKRGDTRHKHDYKLASYNFNAILIYLQMINGTQFWRQNIRL